VAVTDSLGDDVVHLLRAHHALAEQTAELARAVNRQVLLACGIAGSSDRLMH
jgi:hypothetical protein